jgi:hypothetical protein
MMIRNRLIELEQADSDNPMAYDITVRENGILIFAGTKALTLEDGEHMQRDFDFFLATATTANPLKVLFASGCGRISPPARQAFIDLVGDDRLGKLALLKPNNFDQIMAAVALKRNNRNQIRFFDVEKKAIAWLEA